MDDLLDLSNDFLDDDFLYWDFHYLRNLDYLLDHSWHNNYFLYDLLHLDHFRDLHHLLDDLVYVHSHFFDYLNVLRNLNNLLLEMLDYPWNIDIMSH